FAIGRRSVNGNNAADLQRFNDWSTPRIKFLSFHLVQNFKLRLGNLQSAGLPGFFNLAVERDHLPGLESVAQVFAMKPDALDLVAALPHNQTKDGHAPGAKQSKVAHLGDDRGHLARPQLRDPARVQPVFVAEWQIIEQVIHGVDVLVLQPLGHARANALDELYFSVEFQHRLIRYGLRASDVFCNGKISPLIFNYQITRLLNYQILCQRGTVCCAAHASPAKVLRTLDNLSDVSNGVAFFHRWHAADVENNASRWRAGLKGDIAEVIRDVAHLHALLDVCSTINDGVEKSSLVAADGIDLSNPHRMLHAGWRSGQH